MEQEGRRTSNDAASDQNEYGFVSRAAAEKLSLISGIPLARIYGVITFYHFFKTEKLGKHRIAVYGNGLLPQGRSGPARRNPFYLVG